MTYPENLSLVELAEHYATYRDSKCMEELANRDKLSKMTYDERMGLRFEEPDNQKVFGFHKDIASAQETANNTSVKDKFEQGTAEVKHMSGAWKEAYEQGRRIGFKQGLKEVHKEEVHKEEVHKEEAHEES